MMPENVAARVAGGREGTACRAPTESRRIIAEMKLEHMQKAVQSEIQVTPEIAAEHGLTAEEYARIQEILGRDPNYTELGIFSVMWSEHCSYKSSRVHLKRLPTTGKAWCRGRGKMRASSISATGICAVFKIESHNHPSFVEPFQGAATGVGGILRDIFTMGARPIAVMDSLRFGEIAGRERNGKGEERRGTPLRMTALVDGGRDRAEPAHFGRRDSRDWILWELLWRADGGRRSAVRIVLLE